MNDQQRLGIGQLITSSQQRDAIHVAIIPVTAAERLAPGQKVTLVISPDPGRAIAAGDCNMGIGYVDPSLMGDVNEGETFWLFLHPGTIRSLRHEWSSDVFPLPNMVAVTDGADLIVSATERAASEQWLRDFAAEMAQHGSADAFYHSLLSAPEESGESWFSVHTESNADNLNADHSELVRHIENVTGRRMAGKQLTFTCWC